MLRIPTHSPSTHQHLWFVWFPGVGCVQLSEDTLGFGKQRLLFVDVINPGLPAPKHQNHRTGLQAWGEMGGSHQPADQQHPFLQTASLPATPAAHARSPPGPKCP